MSRKALRAAAVVVSLCFVLGAVPMLGGADKGAVKFNILSILKKPVLLLSSLLGIYPPVLIVEDAPEEIAVQISGSTSTSAVPKTTGDDTSNPPPNKKD